jgi:hypothetical protein
MRLVALAEVDAYGSLLAQVGDELRTPGVHAIPTTSPDSSFAFVTLTPWQRKLGSHVNGYHMGFWPGERSIVTAQYENPEGFIEVSRDRAETRISTHFTLRDFLTHDQAHVWPKYVVVREELIDKLELVLDALRSFGVATQHVVVLSGFRSPHYNSRGNGEGWRQRTSSGRRRPHHRCQPGWQDGGLNRDGRADSTTHRSSTVSLVEHKYPDLVGGLGWQIRRPLRTSTCENPGPWTTWSTRARVCERGGPATMPWLTV